METVKTETIDGCKYEVTTLENGDTVYKSLPSSSAKSDTPPPQRTLPEIMQALASSLGGDYAGFGGYIDVDDGKKVYPTKKEYIDAMLAKRGN